MGAESAHGMAMTKAKLFYVDETQLPWTTGETCCLCRRISCAYDMALFDLHPEWHRIAARRQRLV
jgi:hypothetical protein